MSKLLCFLLLALTAFSQGALFRSLNVTSGSAPIALVTSKAGAASGDAATSVITGFNATTANLIVCNVSYFGSGFTGVADDSGNTYQYLTAAASSGVRARIAYAQNATVGSNMTITATADFPGIVCQAFKNVSTTAFDGQQNSGTSTTSTSLQLGSMTPAEPGALVFLGYAVGDNQGVVSIDDMNFTLDTTNFVSGGLSVSGYMAYSIQTSAAAVSPTATLGMSTPSSGAVAGAAFKP